MFARAAVGAYPPPDRWLEAASTSGAPRISVAAGRTGTPGTLAMCAKGNCCRGHVIIMKAYDDENQELGRLTKTHDPDAGLSSFAFDCSAVGAAECDVELFDSSGMLITAVRVVNGAAFHFADADADCPGESAHEWRMALLLPAVQKLRENRCSPIGNLVLPDGTAVAGVMSYACTPVAPAIATSGKRLRLTAEASYSNGAPASLVVRGASFTPHVATVKSDIDGDGDVDGTDYGVLAACFNGASNSASGGCLSADLDGDFDVDGVDFGLFSSCFNGSGNPPACG